MTSTTKLDRLTVLDKVEPTGLVCGYRVDGDGTMTELDWADMDAALRMADSHVWLHFNQSDARAREWITACTHLPAEAKTILLGSEKHMKIEASGEGLAGVVGDLHHEFAEKSDQLDVLRLYLDNRVLISARKQPLQAIDKLRRQIGEGLKIEKPVGLITQFLHHVTDTLGDLLAGLTETIDDLEEELLSGRLADRGKEIGRVRRVSARLRRHMVPQNHALIGLVSRMPAWVQEGDATNLRTAIERLSALGHDLDLVQERARLLQDQLSGLLSEATNRNLYILSIVTTIFLPATLISGVFGMNLGGMPWNQDPLGFYYGLVIMVVIGLLTVWLLRRARML